MEQPPIDSHGFLSDTHTTALVGPDGGVDWLCTPEADGPSLFARILDRECGGSWRVGVVDGRITDRRYEPGTFVLVTSWQGPHGAAEVVDLLAVEPSDDPDDLDARHVLLRRVRGVRGRVRVSCSVDARPDYARQRPRWRRAHGAWAEEVSGIRLHGGSVLQRDGDLLVGTTDLGPGDTVSLALDYLPAAEGGRAPADTDDLVERTLAAWRSWDERGEYDGPAPGAVRRSALLLRALSFDETGALLAAPTTSLPEELGGERNWDYRFTWHRDASLHVMALYLLGHSGLGHRYGEFLVDRCVRGNERLRPMAGLRGEQSGAEQQLDHLSGYAGSRPVRIGNEAFEQVQRSTDGFVLDAAMMYFRLAGSLPPGHWEALREVVDSTCRHWQEPDAGIWEMRGPPRHYTHSRLLSWTCIDRGVRLAEAVGDDDAPLEHWRQNRDALRAEILERGWDPVQGAFTMAYDEPALDASLLRMPLLGFLPGDDPRVVATVEQIAERLGAGPALVHRYDPEEVDDGLSGAEGAFLLSSFEMVSALVFIGRVEEAERRFDLLLDRAGPLGLYSEEMDSDGRALGNYPQAFTHLGLIEAAVVLSSADDPEALHAWAVRGPEAFAVVG